MGWRLQEAMLDCPGEDTQFIPGNMLAKIVTPEAIRCELRLASETHELDLDQIVDQIFSCRCRLFAILVLIERAEKIYGFIQQNVSDSDLPFRLGRTPSSYVKPPGFESWPIYMVDTFIAHQWRFLAPCFELVGGSNHRVRHYSLEGRIPLPFVEDDREIIQGGFSQVRRIKIHPAHHNLCRGSQEVRLGICLREIATD